MTNRSFFGAFFAAYWLLGMHFFMHNPGVSGLYMPFNAWGWIFGCLVISLGLWRVAQQQAITFSSIQSWLWVGALLMLLPMAYPGFEFKVQAVPRLLGLFAGLLFLFSLYQLQPNRQSRDKWLHVLLGAVAIEALLGLVQFYLLTPGNWIGYDTQVNRPYGIFQQPNVMATFMATGIALAAWLQTRSQSSGWLQGLRYGVIIAASLLLVLLLSRIGQLSGLLVLVLLAPQLHRKGQLGRVLSLVGVGVLLGLASQYLSHNVAARGLEIYQSTGSRSAIWAYAAKLMAASPWSGWGYGGFESTFLHQYMADRALNPAMPLIDRNLTHPHNELLYWAVEGGIAPVLGMLIMVGAIGWRLTKTHWVTGMGLLALVTPILLHTQTEYPMYHAIALWWAVLLLLYVLDAEVEDGLTQDKQKTWRTSEHRPKLLMRTLAILLPLMVVPFMLTSLHTGWLVTRFELTNDLSRLNAVVNPLAWRGRIELLTNTLRLQAGLADLDHESLEAYVNWGQGFLRHSPRAMVYANMTRALQALGRHEEAQALQTQGLTLYPSDVTITKAITPTTISGK